MPPKNFQDLSIDDLYYCYITPNFQFTGAHSELPDAGDLGEVIIVDDTTYVWCGSKWEELGSSSGTEASKIKYPSNCKNCGAVLHSEICEYCGTNNYGEE